MILSDRQKFNRMAAIVTGLYQPKDDNNNVSNGQTANRGPIKVAKYATIGITAGQVYSASRDMGLKTVPILCTGVNIGVSAFVAKIKWADYLTYNSVDFGDFGSNIQIDDSKALTDKELLVIGQNTTNMPENDFVLFKINFNMETVPDTVDKVPVNCIMSNGMSMTDCSLLTIKDGQLNWITPIEVNSGYIYFDITEKEKPPEVELPGPTNFPIGVNTGGGGGTVPTGGTSTGSYNLSGYLGGAGGSGAWIVVSIIQNGVVIGFDRQWASSGNFNINGNIDIVGNSPDYGDITIRVEVEPDEEDDTPYYLLIPAFGFSMTITTKVSKGDNNYPKAPLLVQYIDVVEWSDFYYMDIESAPVPVDLDDNMDENEYSDFEYTEGITANILTQEHMDEIGVYDMYYLDVESAPVPVNLDDIMDEVEDSDFNNNDVITIMRYDDSIMEEMGFECLTDTQVIQAVITENSQIETSTSTDVCVIDLG